MLVSERWRGGAALAVYALTIVAANWAIDRFGIVDVGFHLSAPAGVYFAGLAFTARDLVQETLGRSWTVAGILAGAVLSVFVSPQFALASGVAFLLSELADLAVYTPLRERQWDAAVLLSGVVGAVLDSLVFLALAFGSVDHWEGNVVGKLYMVGLAWLAWKPVRGRLVPVV